MTNDQGPKSQSNPNDQDPMTKGRSGTQPLSAFFWDLVIESWDLIGIWRLGHWDFRKPLAS